MQLNNTSSGFAVRTRKDNVGACGDAREDCPRPEVFSGRNVALHLFVVEADRVANDIERTLLGLGEDTPDIFTEHPERDQLHSA